MNVAYPEVGAGPSIEPRFVSSFPVEGGQLDGTTPPDKVFPGLLGGDAKHWQPMVGFLIDTAILPDASSPTDIAPQLSRDRPNGDQKETRPESPPQRRNGGGSQGGSHEERGNGGHKDMLGDLATNIALRSSAEIIPRMAQQGDQGGKGGSDQPKHNGDQQGQKGTDPKQGGNGDTPKK